MVPDLALAATTPCRQVSPGKEEIKMAAIQWDSDDVGYEGWLSAHPHGFMANVYRPPGGTYFRIHCATHKLPDRSKPDSVNPRTGRRYSKVTADSIEELIAWATQKLPALTLGDSNFCKTCGPRGANQSQYRPPI
jgi:5-methylcytosine-specific restriction protein A